MASFLILRFLRLRRQHTKTQPAARVTRASTPTTMPAMAPPERSAPSLPSGAAGEGRRGDVGGEGCAGETVVLAKTVSLRPRTRPREGFCLQAASRAMRTAGSILAGSVFLSPMATCMSQHTLSVCASYDMCIRYLCSGGSGGQNSQLVR